MLKVNVHEVKARLAHYLDRALAGEQVVICRRNVPIAELRPIRAPARGERRIGIDEGRFEVPAAFFEPLPDSLIEAFEGRAP